MVVKRNQSPIAEERALARENAPLVEDKYPVVERMVIRMTYFQKGENPVLMNRMVNVYPDTDHAYFLMPCMIRECEPGGFDLGPEIGAMVRKKEKVREGSMFCMAQDGELPKDHASIKYRIEIKYWKGGKRPAAKKPQKIEEKAAAAPVRKASLAERISAKRRQVGMVRKTGGGAFRVPKAATDVPVSKKTPAKKATVQKAPAKKAAVKKTAVKKTMAKKATAKKAAVKKVPVKKTPVKKASAKKAVVKKSAVKTAAKKTPVKKAPVKKTAVKKTPVKKAPVKKTAVKKTPVKKTAPKKASARKTSAGKMTKRSGSLSRKKK